MTGWTWRRSSLALDRAAQRALGRHAVARVARAWPRRRPRRARGRASLARYIAASASRIRSSGVGVRRRRARCRCSPAGRPRRPRRGTARRTAPRSARRSRARSASPATSSQRTVNSSPPKRAIVSLGRSSRAQARGDVAQQAVAGGVAEGVVDELEAVEVDEQHRHAALAPARRGAAPARGGRGTASRLGRPVSESCSAWWASSASAALRSVTSRVTATISREPWRSTTRRARFDPAHLAVGAPNVVLGRRRLAARRREALDHLGRDAGGPRPARTRPSSDGRAPDELARGARRSSRSQAGDAYRKRPSVSWRERKSPECSASSRNSASRAASSARASTSAVTSVVVPDQVRLARAVADRVHVDAHPARAGCGRGASSSSNVTGALAAP